MSKSAQFDMGSASTSNLFTDTRKPTKVRLVLGILLLIFVVLSIVFIVLYVNEKNDEDDSASAGQAGGQGGRETTTVAPTTNPSTTANSTQTCEEPSCVISAGDILQKLDTSVKPCDDFYQYSCGGFVDKNFIGDDESSINSFSMVNDAVKNHLRALLEDEKLMKNHSQDPNSAVSKAFAYYRSCMNTTQIENAGQIPIKELVEDHGSCSLLNKNWTDANWSLEQVLGRVMGELGLGVFVSIDVSASLFNTSNYVLGVGGGVSGLGESLNRADQAQQTRIVHGYLKYLQTVFKLLGVEGAVLGPITGQMLIMEATYVQLKRNLGEVAAVEGYSKVTQEMTMDELNNLTEYKFNWTTYLNEALSVAGKSVDEVLSGDKKVTVALPNDVKKIVDLITNTTKSLLANEIIWNIIKGSIISLPKAFREAESDFTSIVTGVETPTPRWRSCGDAANKHFEYATTLLYADKYLSEEARQRAADLFTEIQKQFIDGLEEQTWMDNATRDQARIKLNSMKQSIGYPAFIKDKDRLDKLYEPITVDPHDLFQNNLKLSKAKVVEKIKELETPPDDSRFPQPPVGVNAFYQPQENKITALVGMLIEPFYGSERLKALNYGAVGVILGHEITHGFDVSGSQFDENGNLRSWWTAQSLKNYQNRSSCITEQYNNTYVYGRKLDGLKTLSENIADNGGLKYSYRAYKKWRETNGKEDKLPGLQFNNDQLFFISFAQTWCAKYREEYVTILLQRDTHSLNPARVRNPISNFPEFSKAFNCDQPKEYCTVW